MNSTISVSQFLEHIRKQIGCDQLAMMVDADTVMLRCLWNDSDKVGWQKIFTHCELAHMSDGQVRDIQNVFIDEAKENYKLLTGAWKDEKNMGSRPRNAQANT